MSTPDRLRAVEIRHLMALRAIAEERSFRRAGRRLGYTQSAISQQVAALERIVGERLVDRRARGRSPVALTEAGALLLRHAEAIAARIATAEAELASLRNGSRGVLKIGVYQSVGTRLMPHLLRILSKTQPDIDVHLHERRNDVELFRELESGRTDLAFVNLPLPDGPFEALALLRDPYVFVVQAKSPLGRSASPSPLAQLAAMPLLCFETGRCLDRLVSHLSEQGPAPNIVYRSDHNDTLQAMAAAGLGLAVLPRLAVDEHDPRTRTLEPTPPLPPRVIALAWHGGRIKQPSTAAFVELVRGTYVKNEEIVRSNDLESV